MYRLAALLVGLELKVFYLDEVFNTPKFDADYGEDIHWGVSLLEGFEAEQCADAKDLERKIALWAPDVVLMYGYSWRGAPAMIVRRWLSGVPQIHRGTMNFHPDPRAKLRSFVLTPFRRWLLRRFTAHHYGGEHSRKVLIDAGVKPQSLFFVPFSVDSRYFAEGADMSSNILSATHIRRNAGWAPEDKVLLLICQHCWVKGPDIAMEVMRRYREKCANVRLIIVGSGPMTEDMRRFANTHQLEDSIVFSGFVPSHETIPYYLAADLVLCTSRYETWARMVNEAMLCRRPCLVSHVIPVSGGLVDDGVNGYVVQSLTTGAYVEAITRHFRSSVQKRRMMGDAAREAAQRFSYEQNINAVLQAARHASRRDA